MFSVSLNPSVYLCIFYPSYSFIVLAPFQSEDDTQLLSTSSQALIIEIYHVQNARVSLAEDPTPSGKHFSRVFAAGLEALFTAFDIFLHPRLALFESRRSGKPRDVYSGY